MDRRGTVIYGVAIQEYGVNKMTDYDGYAFDRCEECRLYGDDYYYDEDYGLVCNCEGCGYNTADDED